MLAETLGKRLKRKELLAMRKQTKNIRIRITKKHISAGVRGDDQSCPIALALKEKNIKFGSVGDFGIYRRKSCRGSKLFAFPPEVTVWVEIYDFSSMSSSHPFTFTIPSSAIEYRKRTAK